MDDSMLVLFGGAERRVEAALPKDSLPQVMRGQRSGMLLLPQGIRPQDPPPLQDTLSLQSLNYIMAGSPASTSVDTLGNVR